MNLIKVNLLPYREMREAKLKKHFQFIMGMGAVAGIAAAAVIFLGLSEMLDNQNQRNTTLDEGLKALDKDLAEIKELQKRKQDFLLRKSKVEELDHQRFEGARMIDTLNQLVPDGVYLTSLDPVKGSGAAAGRSYAIRGFALSEQKVAMLMNSLPSTGVFTEPVLVSIKQNETVKAQEFVLNTKLVEQKMTVPTPAPSSASTPANAPAK